MEALGDFHHGAFGPWDDDYSHDRLKEGDMGCQMAHISPAFSFPCQEGRGQSDFDYEIYSMISQRVMVCWKDTLCTIWLMGTRTTPHGCDATHSQSWLKELEWPRVKRSQSIVQISSTLQSDGTCSRCFALKQRWLTFSLQGGDDCLMDELIVLINIIAVEENHCVAVFQMKQFPKGDMWGSDVPHYCRWISDPFPRINRTNTCLSFRWCWRADEMLTFELWQQLIHEMFENLHVT